VVGIYRKKMTLKMIFATRGVVR